MLNKAVILFLATVTSVHGHSHLANPLPTRRLDCRVGNGRSRACHGPCAPLDTFGEPTGISPNRPAETWRRGEKRSISWHRNNHGKGESGFVRFTLVPVDKMMDKAAHQRFTFQISCWSSGIHSCRSRHERVCGNDADGKAYKVPITVPTAYPDGVYVFGWAWYGGGDFSGKGFFGDYYSCSFVRIQGGKAVSQQSKPIFYPGLNQKPDSCISATDRVGVCWKEPCRKGSVRPMRPRDLPSFIRSRDLGSKSPASNNKVASNSQSKKKENSRGARGGSRRFKISGIDVYDLRTRRTRLIKKKRFRIKKSDYRKGFTLGLRVSGAVSKVTFRYRGRVNEEEQAPFIVNGNNGRQMSAIRCRGGETINFNAIAYGTDGRRKEQRYSVKCI